MDEELKTVSKYEKALTRSYEKLSNALFEEIEGVDILSGCISILIELTKDAKPNDAAILEVIKMRALGVLAEYKRIEIELKLLMEDENN